MSLAVAKGFESLSPILLQRDEVGIGPLLPQDVGPLFLWMNDIAAIGQDLAYRPTDGAAFSRWLDAFTQNPSHVLFIIRESGNAAGFVFLSNIHPVHRSAELGIRVGRECDRGRGIGRAATTLALDYAWAHLNLVRVQLRVMTANARAIRAYEGAGFRTEGRHVRSAFVSGRWHDMLTMAALNPAVDGDRAAGNA